MKWLTWFGLAVTAVGLFHLWVKVQITARKHRQHVEAIQEARILMGELQLAVQAAHQERARYRQMQKELQCSPNNSSKNESQASEPAKLPPSSA